MIDLLTKELLAMKQEILNLKTSSLKSAVGLGAVQTPVTISTPTKSTGDYSGRAYITIYGTNPFIAQGYFDDKTNFQSDHISFIETLFFPTAGVCLMVVRVINKNPSNPGATFTDDMTLVTTSSVAVNVEYEVQS